MLLVGDIHINSKFKDSVIDQLRSFVDKNSDEKNIVFMGDYVYHFTYDRRALLDFFNFLLSLFEEGKNIYVLTGNHDRVNESFVFEEARKSFDILNQKSKNKLYFIVEPFVEKLEGEDVFFLPFNINIQNSNSEYLGVDSLLEKQIEQLNESRNQNEQLSARINNLLLHYINEAEDKLFVVHHYYFANVKFPGQKTKFNFKDVALSEKFLDYENLFFLSGHLHKGFVHKNYFCSGDFWNISSLEKDKFNFLYKLDLQNFLIYPESVCINMYVSIDRDNLSENYDYIDREVIENRLNEIKNENISNLKDGIWQVSFEEDFLPSLEKISVIIYSQTLDYDSLKEVVSDEVFKKVSDIKIKTQSLELNEVMDVLEDGQKSLDYNISDRKNLLERYIRQKFGEDAEKYIEKLRNMKIFK